MSLKVLMMGGRRCGKTSALASMFDQMTNGETKKYLTVNNSTILEEKIDSQTGKLEKQDSLINKKLELEYFITNRKNRNRTFLVDSGPTMFYWDYKMKVKIPGTKKETEIEFRDSNGEYFDAGGKHHQETIDYIKDCDVFVVVVDVPYLMEGSNAENMAANVVDSIHTFLTEIDNDNGRKAKQVIFVPIKCEKWIHEGRVDDVVSKIEKTYDSTIQHLKATGKTEISIIPIQTAGDIVFSELRDPYLVVNTLLIDQERKCSKISDRLVVLGNGENYKLLDNEVVNEDYKAVFPGTSIPKPYCWYHLPTDKDAEYRPHNCEQLSLHIIRFMFNKLKSETKDGFFARWMQKWFGSISKEDMQNALDGISRENLIKDNEEGIKIIKKCF